MKYYVDLFSPETADAFSVSDRKVTGFRIARKSYVENQGIKPGDKFICYCTKVQRFIGVLKVVRGPYVDHTPRFTRNDDDPFVLRFAVEPLVWLPLEQGIPIRADRVWNGLSFTRNLPAKSQRWTHMVLGSPKLWPQEDSRFLEEILTAQQESPVAYPFSPDDRKKMKRSRIPLGHRKETDISVPEDRPVENEGSAGSMPSTPRESILVQAKLAEIGEKLGLKIWLPKSDRSRVCELWQPKKDVLLDELPLVFDENTLKTIKNIDILWIKRRSVVRAFEVEDTTSIYSGILRMADLLSLQPMLDIKIHIVAPSDRREAVFEQITRPVFAVMEKGPLADICTYIAYDSIDEILKEKQLKHMTDTILDEYVEYANE